jgi:outer membrane biosynthesis protein TonB
MQKWLILFICFAIHACAKENHWQPTQTTSQCDPSTRPALTTHPQWSRTLGQTNGTIRGCLRLSWGNQQHQSTLVQVNANGLVKAYDDNTQDFTRSPSFSLPDNASTKERAFELFAFGQTWQTRSLPQQQTICRETVNASSFSCLQTTTEECWFSWAFQAQSTSSLKVAELPEQTTCTIRMRTPEPLSPEPTQDTTRDAPTTQEPSSEPPTQTDTPETAPEPTQERPQEPIPDTSPTEQPPEPRPADTIPEAKPETTPETPTDAPPALPSGVTTFAGVCKSVGAQDGPGATATFRTPYNATLYAPGNTLYIADYGNSCIRAIDLKTANVSTFSGTCGASGNANGDPRTQARYNWPWEIYFLGPNYYITDSENHCIRVYNGISKQISTLAGTCSPTFLNIGYKDGALSTAKFNYPSTIISLNNNELLLTDQGNNCIRKINLQAKTIAQYAGKCGSQGATDGDFSNATFSGPVDMLRIGINEFYVLDSNNNRIRILNTQTKQVSTLVTGLKNPKGFTYDGQQTIYIADTFHNCIKALDIPTKKVTEFSGKCSFTTGYKDGSLLLARYFRPYDIEWAGNKTLYVIDSFNSCIRRIVLP